MMAIINFGREYASSFWSFFLSQSKKSEDIFSFNKIWLLTNIYIVIIQFILRLYIRAINK